MRLWPFAAWLVAFYAVWTILVVVGNRGPDLLDHWGIALAMTGGAYFAGSTPMGGGTIGFPFLVLLQEGSTALGRDFSFAVQSIGMTSASIFFFCSRQPIVWTLLRSALVGGAIGTPLGIVFVAPLVSDLLVKILFATLWGSFGILHLHRLREFTQREGALSSTKTVDQTIGFAVGLVGGAGIASVTGVGIDMLLYTVLVLIYHADLRAAIATSVVLMAFVSLIGAGTQLILGGFEQEVADNWFAAAPVVVIAAPVGAMIVRCMGRTPTLLVVSVLCVFQFAWTLRSEWQHLAPWGMALTLIGLGFSLFLLDRLYRIGNRLAGKSLPFTGSS